MVNCSLGDLLRCLPRDHVKSWDHKLCQVEFAYNHAVNRSLGFSPFQVIYSLVLHGPVNLIPLPNKYRVHGRVSDFVVDL